MIKVKHAGLQSSRYIDSSRKNIDKGPKIKVGDIVRISKYLKLRTKKVKKTAPWTNVINDLNGEEIVGTFYKKELQFQKSYQKLSITEKVIKRKRW